LAAALHRHESEDGTSTIKLNLLLDAAESQGETAPDDFALRILDIAEAAASSWQSAGVLDVMVSGDFYRKVIVEKSAVERTAYRSVTLSTDGDSTEIWVRQAEVADALLSWLDDLPSGSQAALELLRMCVFFADQPLPLNWFTDGGSLGVGVPELVEALRDGASRGLVVIRQQNEATVWVHRLPLLVLRDRMTAGQRSDARRAVHQLLASLDPGDPTRPERWPLYRDLLPHARASELVKSDNQECRALVINLMRYLYAHGEQHSAAELALQAWNEWGHDNETDPQSLDVANYRGLFLWALGRFKDAAEVNDRTLAVRREVSGEGARETILARLRVAVDVRTRGDFIAARAQNLAIHEEAARLFGEDDPTTLQAAHDLAVVTRLCGDYRAAFDLNVATWRLREEVLGADSPDTLNTRTGEYMDQRELGEYPAALAGHREVAGRLLELVGEEAPATQLRMAYLAVALRKTGDYSGALELSRRTYELLTRVYGPNHPCTLACAIGYATDLRYDGRIDEAHDVETQARGSYEDILGANHPLTLAADANAAVTLRLQGHPAAARELNVRTRGRFTESLGADHPHAIACAINLASDLAELGELDAAVQTGAAAHMRAESTLGPDHPTTLAVALNLTLDEAVLGRDTTSRNVDIRARYRSKLGAEHPATLGAEVRARANCDIDPLPM
jgi:tetratricopeptide (TPR) repeat protein